VRRPAALALLLLMLLPGLAMSATPRASYSDVEDELMCVTCNIPLPLAESPQAERQKAELRRLVDTGMTKDRIKDQMVAEYGSNVLALPKDDGIGIAAYLIPILAGIGILGLLAVLLPRWRRRSRIDGTEGAEHGESLSSAETQRLDEELARFDS
jgi:cytochrome c-type biogenesis protein CcmH